MAVLQRISYFQKRGDEIPNQELARELVAARDKKGIREIAKNLWNENTSVQSDCVKVLYEIGYLEPKLVAPYVDDFIKLLASKNNRLVWGSMIALSTIASIATAEILKHLALVTAATENGSVITRDNGVKTLALVAASNDDARRKIFPNLLHTLETCRPKEVPQYAESCAVAVDMKNRAGFIKILETRMSDMPVSRATRVRKVIKQVSTLK
jgi:hypothetical protein